MSKISECFWLQLRTIGQIETKIGMSVKINKDQKFLKDQGNWVRGQGQLLPSRGRDYILTDVYILVILNLV